MTTVAIRGTHVLVVSLLLGLGVVFQGALPARGCTCMQPDPYAGLVEADGAFESSFRGRDSPPIRTN